MAGLSKVYLYEGADAAAIALLEKTGNASFSLAQALRAFYEHVREQAGADLLSKRRIQYGIVLNGGDAELVSYLGTLERGGKSRFIRAALYWYIGREGGVDALADAIAGRLLARGVGLVAVENPGDGTHDDAVMRSLDQWKVE